MEYIKVLNLAFAYLARFVHARCACVRRGQAGIKWGPIRITVAIFVARLAIQPYKIASNINDSKESLPRCADRQCRCVVSHQVVQNLFVLHHLAFDSSCTRAHQSTRVYVIPTSQAPFALLPLPFQNTS